MIPLRLCLFRRNGQRSKLKTPLHLSLSRPNTTSSAAININHPASVINHPLSYDRDTGIIWEMSSSPHNRIRPLYQTIIGIEIHAQLSIPTKLFSSAPTRHNPSYGVNATHPANTLVHAYDIAYPGTLPSLSQSAVKASVLSAAALGCTVHRESRFERKHYFYPDLPLGYQITQQRWPLASDGLVTFEPYSNSQSQHQQTSEQGNEKKRRRGGRSRDINNDEGVDAKSKQNPSEEQDTIQQLVQLRIERIQIEQDTGKTTTHVIPTNNPSNPDETITKSYIDYNRAGCALIEIVSHPDLRSAHEAAGVVEKIRKLLKHVGSCDGRMEEGSLRCDLNVSIAPILDANDTNQMLLKREELPPDTGHRVEVKNLNSLRQIIAATEYEALRQSSLAMVDDPTGRETRTFHVKPISDRYPLGGETICIRSKGDAIDYRFMPEPDLPPLILDEETLGCERGLSLLNYIEYIMPESQEEAAARLVKDYGLSEDVANVITGDPAAIAMLEETVDAARRELRKLADQNDDTATHIDDWTIPTMAANWLSNDVFALVKKSALEGKGASSLQDVDEASNALNHPISVEYSTVDGSRLGCLIAMIINGTLTSSMAKKILTIMYKEDLDSSPLDIANANGWRVISDMTTLLELCERVVLDPKNSKQLEQYKQGGKIWKIEKFFVGKIMGASQGNVHPERMKEALGIVLSRV